MERRAFWIVSLAAIIAGFSGPIIKQISIPPISLAWIRMAVPVLFMGGFLVFKSIQPFRQGYRKMLIASFLNAARMYLFFVAFIYASVSNAAIMIYTWPIFASLLGFAVLKEQVSTKKLLLLLLAFCGIVITYSNQEFSFDSKEFIGMTAGLGSSFIYAISIIIFKSSSHHYSTVELVFFQNLVGAILFLPLFLIAGIVPDVKDWTISIGYAMLMGILVFNMIFYGLKALPASTTSMIMYLEFVSAILLGVFLMDDPFTWNMGLGALCIIVSTLLLRIRTNS